MKEKKQTCTSKFPGFSKDRKGQFFMYPTIMEKYWADLTGVEQKVLDYIFRQTIGYGKNSDKISLSQFAKGNGNNSRGAGVGETQTVNALRKLEEMGFIRVKRKPRKTNEISLVYNENADEVMCRPLVKELILLFEPVAGHKTETFLCSQPQINALEKLLQYYGEELVRSCIESLSETNCEQYIPKIVSPCELQNKFSSYIAAIQTFQMEHNQYLHIPTNWKKWSS